MRKFIYLLLFLALTFVLITSCSEHEKLPKDFSSEEEKELEEGVEGFVTFSLTEKK